VCLLITSFQHIGSSSPPELHPSLRQQQQQQQKTCQVPEAELISSLKFFSAERQRDTRELRELRELREN
jgi:hypothetical protein